MYSDIKPTAVYKNLFEGDTIKEKYDFFKKWYLDLEINDNYLFLKTHNLTVDIVLENATYDKDGNLIYVYHSGNSDEQTIKLDIPSIKTFALLFHEYCDNHIAYDIVSFMMKYANVMCTYYKEYEQTSKAIDKLMNLTEDDIAIDNCIITNSADIPETESSTNVEEVNYVSVQQKNINKKGKLQISKELLYNKKSYTTKTFLNRFRHLFIRILSHSHTALYEEDLED